MAGTPYSVPATRYRISASPTSSTQCLPTAVYRLQPHSSTAPTAGQRALMCAAWHAYAPGQPEAMTTSCQGIEWIGIAFPRFQHKIHRDTLPRTPRTDIQDGHQGRHPCGRHKPPAEAHLCLCWPRSTHLAASMPLLHRSAKLEQHSPEPSAPFACSSRRPHATHAIHASGWSCQVNNSQPVGRDLGSHGQAGSAVVRACGRAGV